MTDLMHQRYAPGSVVPGDNLDKVRKLARPLRRAYFSHLGDDDLEMVADALRDGLAMPRSGERR